MTTTATITTAHFTKLDGDWFIAVPTGTVAPGEQVTVSLKSGATKTVTTSAECLMAGDDDLAGWDLLEEAPRTRTSHRSDPRRKPSTTNRATAKQVSFAAKLDGKLADDDRNDLIGRRSAFTRTELGQMSRADISSLIDTLKSAF